QRAVPVRHVVREVAHIVRAPDVAERHEHLHAQACDVPLQLLEPRLQRRPGKLLGVPADEASLHEWNSFLGVSFKGTQPSAVTSSVSPNTMYPDNGRYVLG